MSATANQVFAESKLETPSKRFLSHGLMRALDPAIGILTPKDVVDFVTVQAMMKGMEHVPDRRVKVYVDCELVPEAKVASARRKSATWGAELLADALEEGDITPEDVCRAIPPDDLVRFVPPPTIWALLTSKPWIEDPKKEDSDQVKERAQKHRLYMAELLVDLFAQKLLSPNPHLRAVHAIGEDQFMSDQVPHEMRTAVLQLALKIGDPEGNKKGIPFTGTQLFIVLKPHELIKWLALPVLGKVLEELAKSEGWVVEPPPTADPPPADEEEGQTRRPPPLGETTPPPAEAPAAQAEEEPEVTYVEPVTGTTSVLEAPLPTPQPVQPKIGSDEDIQKTQEEVELALEGLEESDGEEKDGDVKQVSRVVPLSRPGDGIMVTAETPEAADLWKGKVSADDTPKPGSGSRSSSSLKPKT